MTALDTDVLSLLMNGHARIAQRVEEADEVVITIVSRIEVLQGRFASILKAADGDALLRAQARLQLNEEFLRGVEIIPFNAAAAAEFDRLRADRSLRKIG